jgi:hypothetical protein
MLKHFALGGGSFFVMPLKGRPMGGGRHLLLTALLLNGAWGRGTGLMLKELSGWSGTSHDLLRR